MPAILELIRTIEQRPAMYFGTRSLVRLKAFLDGWRFAKGHDADDEQFLAGFQEWIQQRYRITSSHSWADIIGFFEENDVAAFEKAMFLINEYADSQPR